MGTPDYGLPGCGHGEYNSVFVVRRDTGRQDLKAFQGARFALNSFNSQSGWAGPIIYAQEMGVTFGSFTKTGAHLASAQAVAGGDADLACLDALSWHYIKSDPGMGGALTVIDRTPPSPATPYITSLGQDAGVIRQAISDAIDTLSENDRSALHLKGIVWIAPAEYAVVPTPPLPQG